MDSYGVHLAGTITRLLPPPVWEMHTEPSGLLYIFNTIVNIKKNREHPFHWHASLMFGKLSVSGLFMKNVYSHYSSGSAC